MQVIIIGKPIKYKGFHILVQNIGMMFQVIIFRKGEFFQLHNEILYGKGRSRFTTKELTNGYKFMMDQAISTCELILDPKGKNLKKKALKGKTKKQKDIITGVSEHNGRNAN